MPACLLSDRMAAPRFLAPVAALSLLLAWCIPANAAARHRTHLPAPVAASSTPAPRDTVAWEKQDDASPATEVKIGASGVSVSVDDSDAGGRHKVVVVGPHVSVDDDGQIVRLFTDVEVPAGQRVDGDVVTVFGSSRIGGHVTGNAVAVFGSVTLGPGSAVDGDMVAIFGGVHRAETATVGGETVDLGFEPLIPGLPALPTVLLLAGMFWVLSLIGGWLVSILIPGRLVRITATASRRMGGSLLIGLAGLPLVILTVVLLCITVIGIPVAALLPIAYGFVVWIGLYAGLYGLGQKLLRRRLHQGSVFSGILTGTLFVAGFFALAALLASVPGLSRSIALFLFAVGSLICLALQLIGCGAVMLSRFGTRPQDLEPSAAPMTSPVVTAPQAPPVGA